MMTLNELKKRGWTIEKGAYYNTCDDRYDRWYAYKYSTYNAIDRRGKGFSTRREAIEAASRWEENQDQMRD